MNIAVATRFEVFVVDGEGEYIGSILPPEYALHHYGLTWSEDLMFVYCWGGYHWIEVLDHNLKSVDRILAGTEIGDSHQIAWHKDRLWVCHTNWERYVVCDVAGNVERIWTPLPERGIGRPGSPHFNSIWFHAGDVFIVASNWGEAPAEILRYSPELELIDRFPAALAAHSVYRHQGKYLTLGTGQVLWGNKAFPLPSCEVMKGIVCAGGRMFFGVQQNIPRRQERRRARAGWICEVSTDTLEPLHMCNFGRGQVNEIRALDEPDYAHHGIVWEGKYGA